ncbi:hypothetical protein [Spirosoma endophyticum]|uniref:Beta-lactamase-inhibitor-like, PepSY-like n=1 Tax=Spirosoma endophyticum TaxID=662367 RepID=A0A1I2G743_9BACT|nr:hypothetical protein [Spirosoma endophyticum]SFF13425.1 hypothetical protein SAMN05216167_13034 [Spirosoma endophyticum]
MIKQLYLLAISSLLATASMAQCQELRRIANPFTDKTVVMTTSVEQQSIEPVQYERIDEKGQTQYLLHLYTETGSFLSPKGATVVFKDGAKIQWTDAVVKSFFQKGHYVSRSIIELPEDLVEQFQEKEIAFIKLSLNEQWLTFSQSQRAKNILTCVLFSDVIAIKSDAVISQ